MAQTSDPALEIHSGLILKGRLSMDKDVLLTGKFEGELQTRGRLTVAAGGEAVGTIEAGALVLEPGYRVEGQIKVGVIPPPQPREPAKPKPALAANLSSGFKKLKELAFGRTG